MLSLQIPPSVTVSLAPGLLERVGPNGTFRTPTGGLQLSVVSTPKGETEGQTNPLRRLVLVSTGSVSTHSASAVLATLARAREGLSRGFRTRLRLVGVGFRATRELNQPNLSQKPVSSKVSVASPSSTTTPTLVFKLGRSHDIRFPLAANSSFLKDNVAVRVSRIDGRAKGTLVCLSAPSAAPLHHRSAELQTLRQPDPYKGKGVHRVPSAGGASSAQRLNAGAPPRKTGKRSA
jgi:ribosomal protein L6P/L9E